MEKIRLVVLTDISTLEASVGEPDDTQSFIRLLLYGNHFDIEGLIATYTVHCEGITHVDYLRALVAQYDKVQKNLARHDPAYPRAEALLACIKAGMPRCGMDCVGENGDTEGSDWIIAAVDRPDPRPLWLLAWGGVTDLAQALWRVKKERSAAGFDRFCKKLRVYAVGDQYDEAGPWIRQNGTGLFYITAYSAVRGMYKGGDAELVSPQWVNEHIKTGHGPLGDAYPNYDGGDCWGPVRGVKEGDTPSLLYLLPTGLSDPEHPEWGCWGGRFAGQNNQYVDAQDEALQDNGAWVTVSRWRADYQNSFCARLDWCVKSYAQANHAPVAVVSEPPSLTVRPGDTICLTAKSSYDPDGDALRFHWWIYGEAGSSKTPVRLAGADTDTLTLMVPKDAQRGTLHVMLTLRDAGTPPLCTYHRTLLSI